MSALGGALQRLELWAQHERATYDTKRREHLRNIRRWHEQRNAMIAAGTPVRVAEQQAERAVFGHNLHY